MVATVYTCMLLLKPGLDGWPEQMGSEKGPMWMCELSSKFCKMVATVCTSMLLLKPEQDGWPEQMGSEKGPMWMCELSSKLWKKIATVYTCMLLLKPGQDGWPEQMGSKKGPMWIWLSYEPVCCGHLSCPGFNASVQVCENCGKHFTEA